MSTALHVAREHEFEPQYGLPERLPAAERLLWQGTPRWDILARRAFHATAIGAYFVLMLVWRAGSVLADGGSVADALRSLSWLAPTATVGFGLVLLLAWLTARTTVYTLTDKRVVMRIGIVLTVAYNLPLARIESADLHDGDIALTLERGTRIAWLHLWPHARPWQLKRPRPMLRALPDAASVSALLAQAWAQANNTTVVAAAPAANEAPHHAGHLGIA
jgi:hypothetical protein